jgi:hypothetical protein
MWPSTVTITLVVIGMLALKAVVFVMLVAVGVRLAVGAPIVPDEWLRSASTWLASVKASVARARTYHGSH